MLQRTALIADLVRKAPSAFGRTALLKFLQVLQTMRRVPLGYYFGLYTYGPLNVDVLSDSIKVCLSWTPKMRQLAKVEPCP